jgi:hypothetical protein
MSANVMKCVQGSSHQGDYFKFKKYFGRQCSAMAVSAACKATKISPNLWTSFTVDECLEAGDCLFAKSHEACNVNPKPHYLNVDELQREVSFSSGDKVLKQSFT